MIESIEVLKRLQSINNKINELERYKEHRKQDVQEKKDQIKAKRTLSEEKQEVKISIQKEIDRTINHYHVKDLKFLCNKFC